LQLYASRKKKPAAAVVRDALTEYLSRRQAAALPSFAAAFASGRSDTSARHEDLLFRKLTPHGGGSPAATKTRAKRRRS
jgi:hypothetical protein